MTEVWVRCGYAMISSSGKSIFLKIKGKPFRIKLECMKEVLKGKTQNCVILEPIRKETEE